MRIMALTSVDLLHWVEALQRIYAEKRDYLIQLDSAIGDADHGINMDRGFTAVLTELGKTKNFPDIGSFLKTVAMTLIKTVGGASGPLYGTLFLRASAICSGKMELESADVVKLFEEGLDGVVHRGNAQPLDKTMVDAWTPAVKAMKVALQNGASLEQIMKEGEAAAEEGMRNTIPLIARKGRASYLGERAIGHQDPGATSTFYMLREAARLWK